MPGLLQTPSGKFASAKYAGALMAEFLGVLLFTWAGIYLCQLPTGVVPQHEPTMQGLVLSLTVVGTSTPTGVTSTQNSTGTANSAAANWAPWYVCFTFCILCELR